MKYQITLNGKQYEVEVEKGQATATFLGTMEELQLHHAAAGVESQEQQPETNTAVEKKGEGAQTQNSSSGAAVAGDAVTAPMPGIILDIQCGEGQKVVAGQVLFILEAMKMENELIASRDGTVKQLMIQKNQQVETGTVLCVIG